MEFFNSKKFIVILVLIMTTAALSGCGVKQISSKTKNKMPTEMETIGRLDSITRVLGCMFDPTPCQNSKDRNLPAEYED